MVPVSRSFPPFYYLTHRQMNPPSRTSVNKRMPDFPKQWHVFGLAAFFSMTMSQIVAAPRVWTSADGKSIEAEFVRANAESVTVRRSDGKTYTIPFSRLSPADRQWVDENALVASGQAVYSKLWGENGELWNPEDGTLIDFSRAGYHEGKNDFPSWETGVDVTEFGAVGDGVTDDTEAFRRAIAACPDNRAVFVPNGTYKLMDWLGADRMVDKWVQPMAKNHFVLRGESRQGTVLLLGTGLQEIHPWDQTTGNGRPTSQWSWSGGFLWFQDCTETGVENLTIQGKSTPYGVHWQEPGCNGIYFRNVEHGWVRNVTFVDVDSGVLINSGTFITLEDLIFESTPERPSKSSFEDNEGISGHHAILFGNGSAWCVADGIVFKNRFHHELGINPGANHCVFSNCSGPSLHFDFHTEEDDIPNILFTEIDAGEGDLIWRNNFYGSCSGGVFWNIKGEHLTLPEQKSWVQHSVLAEDRKTLFAGWPERLPNHQEIGRPWFEELDPDRLYPKNIYHAQRKKRLNPE